MLFLEPKKNVKVEHTLIGYCDDLILNFSFTSNNMVFQSSKTKMITWPANSIDR